MVGLLSGYVISLLTNGAGRISTPTV